MDRARGDVLCSTLALSDAAARLDAADLPDDAAALKAMLVAERGGRLELAGEVARLTAIVDAFMRAMFGRRSEKLDPGQLELALEDAEQEIAEDRAGQDAADAELKRSRGQRLVDILKRPVLRH